jgi:hypothetical protein
MWFLSFVPDWLLTWAIHGAVIVGLFLIFGGSLLKNLPIIGPYASMSNQIGSVILLIGVFFEGGLGTEMMYRHRIADMQEKIKVAEAQSVEANQKLTDELSKKQNDIKDKVKQNAKDIQAQRQKIDAECRLSDTAWLLYNRSVDPKVSGSSGSSNGTSNKSKDTTRR